MNDTSNVNPSETKRHEIIERAGSPTVRFMIDSHTFILPYAFFVRAEYHTKEQECLVVAHWTTMTVTIEGGNLERLVNLLSEYRLLSVVLRTEIERSSTGDETYVQRILVSLRETSPSRDKTPRRRRKIIAESVGRP